MKTACIIVEILSVIWIIRSFMKLGDSRFKHDDWQDEHQDDVEDECFDDLDDEFGNNCRIEKSPKVMISIPIGRKSKR